MTARIVLALFALCVAAQSASAGFVLRFQTSAPVTGGVAQFVPGSTNVVQLYLDDDEGAGGPLATNGLVTANLGDPTDFDPFGIELTGFGTIESSTPNPLFNDAGSFGAVNGAKNRAAWTAAVDLFSGPVFGSTTPFGYSVLLGSFEVKAGNYLESGTLTLNPPTGNDFTLGDIGGTAVLPGGGSFNFTAAPEPGALALMGLAVAGGAAFLRRRKPVSQQETPVAVAP